MALGAPAGADLGHATAPLLAATIHLASCEAERDRDAIAPGLLSPLCPLCARLRLVCSVYFGCAQAAQMGRR